MYREHRRALGSIAEAFNRFNAPDDQAEDVVRMRTLHVGMDRAVAEAYEWADLDLDHGFHETKQGIRFTISDKARREVLARLLALNHERYADEVRRGLHDRKRRRHDLEEDDGLE